MNNQTYTPSTSKQTLPYADQAEEKQRRRQERSLGKSLAKNRTQVTTSIILGTLWVALLGGGYYAANHYIESSHAYIDQRLAEAQSANQHQMDKLEEQIQSLTTELGTVQDGLGSIQEELQMTGEALGGTDKTKQALTTRIDQLNKQLGELRASLKKLEDAARAW